MKKQLLYIASMLLFVISAAQEDQFIKEASNRNLNDDNGFLLVQETSNTWDFWESHWEQQGGNTLYTYDENNNLIEELETIGGSKGKRIYLYDDYNKLIEQTHQRWDTSHWTNIDKENFFYDANNNVTDERRYSWWMNDGEWHNDDKYIHSYDVNNNRIYTLMQNFWNGSSWENEKQFTYTYDNNNNLTESITQNWDGSSWINYNKVIYFLDANNNIIEYWSHYWIDNEWVKSSRGLFSYDNNNNWILSVNQHWNGIDWENAHKDIFNYDEHNNKLKWVSQTWFEDNGAYYWLNQRKYTYYYLPSGSEQFVSKNTDLDKPIEDFQTTEDDIIIDPGRDEKVLVGVEVLLDSILHTSVGDLEFTLSHNGISVTIVSNAGGDGDNFIRTKLSDRGVDSLAQGLAPFYGIYKPENPLSAFLETDPAGTWTLSIYDGVEGNTGTLQAWGLNLIYASSSGIDDGDSHHTDLLIYPNPAVSVVSLQWPPKAFGVSQQSAVVEIYDLNGRKFLEKQIPNGTKEYTVDVSHLNSGLYFCRIQTEKGSVTKKLMIQR